MNNQKGKVMFPEEIKLILRKKGYRTFAEFSKDNDLDRYRISALISGYGFYQKGIDVLVDLGIPIAVFENLYPQLKQKKEKLM